MKHAFVIDGVVDTVSFEAVEGWLEVGDDVFAGFLVSAEGEIVAPPAASPSSNPNDYPLSALEFDAALVRLGIDRDAVAPAIRSIFTDDIDAMADSLARWWNLKTMTRDNPVMGMLKPVFNVTDTQIDTAWMETVARRG